MPKRKTAETTEARFEFRGRRYTVRLDEISGLDEAEMWRDAGLTLADLFTTRGAGGPMAVACLVWLGRKQAGDRAARLTQVLEDVKATDLEGFTPVDTDEDEAPEASAAD